MQMATREVWFGSQRVHLDTGTGARDVPARSGHGASKTQSTAVSAGLHQRAAGEDVPRSGPRRIAGRWWQCQDAPPAARSLVEG